MARAYCTFLVDHGGIVPGSVSQGPDTRQPDSESVWKVIYDGGRVVVIGQIDKLTCQVAHARWRAGQLDRRIRLKGAPELSAEVWSVIRGSLASEVGPSLEEKAETKPASKRRQRRAPVAAPYDPLALHQPSAQQQKIIWASFAVVFVGFAAAMYTCGSKDEPAPTPPPVETKTPPPPVVEPLEVKIAKAETFADALALAKPAMAAGPTAFATFAASRLRWEDVNVPTETSFAAAIKDVDAERGKRLCAGGVIRELAQHDIGPRKAYEGQLRIEPADTIQFVAVGTIGTLVVENTALFCGVVIRIDFGKLTMVGMFDLPENRNPIVEQ